MQFTPNELRMEYRILGVIFGYFPNLPQVLMVNRGTLPHTPTVESFDKHYSPTVWLYPSFTLTYIRGTLFVDSTVGVWGSVPLFSINTCPGFRGFFENPPEYLRFPWEYVLASAAFTGEYLVFGPFQRIYHLQDMG